MIPAWKVRLAAAYCAVFFILGLAFCYLSGRYTGLQDAFDRGAVYGAHLPCPAGER